MTESHEATHGAPVWGYQADTVVTAAVDDDGGTGAAVGAAAGLATGVVRERLAARRVAEHRFELCCIPFLAHGLALGDVVATDDDHVVTGVVEPSGRAVFRVSFEASAAAARAAVARDLTYFGCLLEWSSPRLLAVDAEPARAGGVADYLAGRELRGDLVVEAGRTG
jgi:Domain of unknown function (DUF4265)